MFFYYQIRNHHYKTEPVPQCTCPLCGTRGRMHMSVLQKYTWMVGPMAPARKYAIAWCEACDKYIPRVKWTDEMDAEYVKLKVGLQTPRRLYRGLWVMPLILVALIGGILLAVSVTSKSAKKNQDFVLQATLQPQVGDIFQVMHSYGQDIYNTYYKVARVESDSVYMQESLAHPDQKAWDDVPTDAGAFKPETTAFSLAETRKLDGMFNFYEDGHTAAGLVFGVYRDGDLTKKY